MVPSGIIPGIERAADKGIIIRIICSTRPVPTVPVPGIIVGHAEVDRRVVVHESQSGAVVPVVIIIRIVFLFLCPDLGRVFVGAIGLFIIIGVVGLAFGPDSSQLGITTS
jgi:hypothetical protein